MIVGFDPGAKSGLAVIDFDGNLVFLESFRGGLKEAVRKLREVCKPVIVASDKKKLEAVEKLAAAFSAISFFPSRDLSVKEKVALTKSYRCRNDHERDALAAALYAYRKYRKLIEKVKRREVEIFEMLLRREVANISEALRERKEKPKKRRKNIDLVSRIKDLERRVEVLNDLLTIKESELEEAKEEIERLRDERMEKIMRDRKVRKMEAMIRRLKEEEKVRIRLEKALMEAHSRIARIEAELDRLKKARPEEKEDIKAKILRMIREYKERFR